MKFILKLFKALNSAQTPWQVTLALTLGMIAGLTPMSGIQMVVIFFLAFLLNIHLGLFFVSSALFAGIGYLFDPLFEQVGYALLTSEALNGIWTAWYNSGLMRLTYFNNTLVLGSMVVALLLALPLYFLLGWLIDHYREALGNVLSRYPRLGLFGILKVSETRDPLLRWWGAGLFVGVVAILAALTLLLADPLAKWALENGASKLLQRDVRAGSVDIGFGAGSVDIHRLEIAGTQEGIDVVSAEHIGFDIDLNALFFNRTHIEKIAVNGVGFDTAATLQKSVAKVEEAPQTGKAATEAEKRFEMPSFELPKPEELLAKADLKSLKLYDEAKSEMAAIRARWEEVAKTEFSDEVMASFKRDYEALKEQSSAKDPQQLLKLKEDITAFKKKIDERKKRISELQAAFKKDQKRIEELSSQIKNAPMQDYNVLRSAYSLDGSGAMNVVATLFGDKMKGYLATANRYYTMLAPYLKSDKKPAEAMPPRGEGRWVKFALHIPAPELLVKLTEVDGVLKAQAFTATVRDISDNQKALGRPVLLDAQSDGPTISKLQLRAEDNRLGDVVVDRFDFRAKKLPLETMDFSSLTVANTALAFDGEVTLSDAKMLDGDVKMAFADAKITMHNLEGKTAKMVTGVLDGIDRFSADLSLGGTLVTPKVSVKTDLDKKIAAAFGEGLKKEAAAYEGKLKAMLNEQMESQLGSFNTDAANIADINALAGSQSSALGNLGSNASGLVSGSGGGAIKGLLPF